MPLIQSGSKSAVSRNISELMHSGRQQRQAVAIALDNQRRNSRADGGIAAGTGVSGGIAGEQVQPGVALGYLHGATPGRADHVKTTAPAGAYVIPADIVSAWGEGNSNAGGLKLRQWIARKASGRAAGGVTNMPGANSKTPVLLSHGEYVVSPADVAKFGNGDHKAGLRFFDRWVVEQRRKLIKKLRNLPGPVKTQ